MPYQGNRPAENYTKRGYQDFTGGSGQTFTLNQPVAATQDITVVVNNVVQDPADYSVNGTSLTLGGSVSATDDFYVVFNGPSTQSVTHPSDQALEATDGTFSGDVAVDTDTLYVDSTNDKVGVNTASPVRNLDVTGGTQGLVRVSGTTNGGAVECWDGSNGVYFGSAPAVLGSGDSGDLAILTDTGKKQRFYTNGLERVRINEGGQVDLLAQTAAGGIPTQQNPVWQDGPYHINLNPNLTNIGNNTSGNTFTAPVAGRYLVSCSFLVGPNSTATSWYLYLQKNSVSQAYVHGTAYASHGFTQILNLNANDTIRFYLSQGRVYTSNHGMWCIAKIS